MSIDALQRVIWPYLYSFSASFIIHPFTHENRTIYERLSSDSITFFIFDITLE